MNYNNTNIIRKILLTFLVVFSISSCLDDEERAKIQDRIIAIDNVKMVKDTFNLGEKVVGEVHFSFNPSCEVLYPSYYLELKEITPADEVSYEAKIARFAQVSLEKECKQESVKNVNDSIFINLLKPGSYTLKFYSGKKENSDSANFITKKIYVRQSAKR